MGRSPRRAARRPRRGSATSRARRGSPRPTTGRLLGFLIGYRSPDEPARRGRPARRRRPQPPSRGLGRALVERFAGDLRAAGVRAARGGDATRRARRRSRSSARSGSGRTTDRARCACTGRPPTPTSRARGRIGCCSPGTSDPAGDATRASGWTRTTEEEQMHDDRRCFGSGSLAGRHRAAWRLFLFRDRLTRRRRRHAVGDCVILPTGAVEFSEIQHRPCNEPHTGEIFHVADYPAQDAFPSEARVRGVLRQRVPGHGVRGRIPGLVFEDAAGDRGRLLPAGRGRLGGRRPRGRLLPVAGRGRARSPSRTGPADGRSMAPRERARPAGVGPTTDHPSARSLPMRPIRIAGAARSRSSHSWRLRSPVFAGGVAIVVPDESGGVGGDRRRRHHDRRSRCSSTA